MTIDFSEARKLKRFPLLDASRGLACIGVVACHCGLGYLMHWYWGVMDFFFVMSGFLITRSLVSNCDKGRGASSFFLYRALRLLPAYVSIMLLYELVVLLTGTRSLGQTVPYLLFYQHTDLILGSKEIFPRIHEMMPFWSLILEEHFYMIWGIFFCFYAYAKLKITPVTIGLCVLLLASGIVMRTMSVHWWTLPGRFDGFLVGSIAGIIVFMPNRVSIPDGWSKWLMGGGWLLVLASSARLLWSGLLSYQDYWRYLGVTWIDITCFSIFSVVLVLGMVKLDVRGLHLGRFQNWMGVLGLVSYEIYLAHFPIVELLKRTFGFHFRFGNVALFLLTMVISTVVAYGMHQILTAPALKRRDKIHAFFTEKFAARKRIRSISEAEALQSNPNVVRVKRETAEEANGGDFPALTPTRRSRNQEALGELQNH